MNLSVASEYTYIEKCSTTLVASSMFMVKCFLVEIRFLTLASGLEWLVACNLKLRVPNSIHTELFEIEKFSMFRLSSNLADGMYAQLHLLAFAFRVADIETLCNLIRGPTEDDHHHSSPLCRQVSMFA